LWFNTSQEQIYVKTTTGFKNLGPFPESTTPDLTNIGDVPATTAYVHSVLPKGSIIMWSGVLETIPSGWALCDGNLGASINGQPIPDLRDRFVMGAGNIYDVLITGGTRTLTDVPMHSHAISGSTGANNVGVGVSALENNTTAVATLGTITGGSGYTNGTYTGVVMTLSSGSAAGVYPTATIVVSGGAVTTVTLTAFGSRFRACRCGSTRFTRMFVVAIKT
jgi:microcystin-dependent protein